MMVAQLKKNETHVVIHQNDPLFKGDSLVGDGRLFSKIHLQSATVLDHLSCFHILIWQSVLFQVGIPCKLFEYQFQK